ncbi:MAK10-like protein [Tanacetum coccineum]
MGNANPIRTLGDYSKPSHEGYKNTIELSVGNNVCEIDCAIGGKLCDKNADESWEIIENLALYDQEGWNDSKGFIKPVKAIFTPQGTSKTPDRRLLELEDQINFLLKGPNPQPQVLGTTFEARVQDYMAAHTERMERFENAIFKQREEINDRMAEIGEEERNDNDDMAADGGINGTDTEMLVKEAEKENEAENGTKNETIKKAENKETAKAPSSQPNALVDQGSDVNVMPLSTYMKLTDERPVETDTRLSLASRSYIYPLGIVEDILVDVAGYVYPMDFVILDIKEDKKRPFILGTPFLTMAKAMIKFDKGTITLRSIKSKISFHRIPESLCKAEKGIKNDIEPIAPTMTVNRLVLEWEEKIKLHLEK